MKIIRKILLIFVGICLACTTVSCAKRTEVKKGDSYIYCLNSDRTGLKKVVYQAKEKDSLKAAEAMVEELKKPAEEIEYTPPIPNEVSVEHYDLEGGILYLDFNAEYKQMPAVEETLVRAALVKSLVQIRGINSVWIRVEGADLTDRSGQVFGYLNEDDFVQSEGASPGSYQTETVTLYFSNDAGDALREQTMEVRYNSNVSKEKMIVERLMASPGSYQTETVTLYFSNDAGDALREQTMEVRYNSNVSKEKMIVERLMKGPQKSSAKATINPDTNLLSVTTKDGICYVNFDKTFLKGAYEVKPQVTIYSLVNSLVQGTGVGKVQISINGENDIKYMQTVDLSQPLKADLSWNEGER